MGERQSGSYGLRRAAPKKINQDFAYFGVKRDEPDIKKTRVSEETHIEILSSPDSKKGRGRPRKSDPSIPEPLKTDRHLVKEEPSEVLISQTLPDELQEEVEETLEEEVVEHTEEIIAYDHSSTQFVLGEDGEAIQIIDFPISVESSLSKIIEDAGVADNSEDKVECEECHKMLKPSSYRQHLKTHLGSKPHSCELCPAKFTRRGDVERHVRIVHKKDKPFRCHKCTRAFGDKKNLRWHLMNHDKKLFHICETCGFKFGKKDYYDNHVKYIHPLPDQDDEEEGEEVEEEEEERIIYSGIMTSEVCAQEEDIDLTEEMTVVRQAVTLPKPKRKPVKSAFSNVIDLSHMQLQSILDQSQGRRIAIVAQDSSIKYLTVAPKIKPKPMAPQVVSIKTLEKMTNLSSQQIVKLHAPSEPKVDPDELKAVVIEVEESEDQTVEEIVVGEEQEVEEDLESSGNVNLIEALLDAAKTSTENNSSLQLFALDNEEPAK